MIENGKRDQPRGLRVAGCDEPAVGVVDDKTEEKNRERPSKRPWFRFCDKARGRHTRGSRRIRSERLRPARPLSDRLSLFRHECDVGFHHHLDQLPERHGGLPAELLSCPARVGDE